MPDNAFSFSHTEPQASPALARGTAERREVGGTSPPHPDRRRRVVLYSHDTFGLGHLRRNLAIAEELLAPGRDFDVLLLSGSPVLGDWPLPKGLRVQALPPVIKVGAETYAPRGGAQPFSLVKGYREGLILQTVMREQPDVFLVDHAPSGMKQELLSTLATVKRDMPQTRLVLGLRDIIDSPDAVRRLWEADDVYNLLDHAYDQILVYGSRELYDVGEAYALPEPIRAKLNYVGYVARKATPAVEGPWPELPQARGARVLVTLGGGGDGFEVMSAYLKALDELPEHATASLLIAGPLMSAEQSQSLAAATAGRSDVALVSSTHDLPALIARADLVVAMGGYNTTTEVLAARKPAILVPRSAPRLEQWLRAKMLEARGLVHVAEIGPNLAQDLAQLKKQALAAGLVGPPRREVLDLAGARRTADALEALTPQKSGRRTAYIMKRYPRLSETFILNEICEMEALGENLEIFSLLPPEPPPHHPAVARVKAPLTFPPVALVRKVAAFTRAHAEVMVAAPVGYARALALVARRTLSSTSPLSSARQFLRAGFFAAEARRRGVTHLHAHFANAPAAVAEFMSRMLGIPFSFTAHAKDLYLTPAPRIAERTAAATFVATCTHYNVDYFNDILPVELRAKINLVYHGVDLSRFRYRTPSYAFHRDNAPASILSVGRLVPKKGLDDLIEACAQLRDMGVAFRCRIVGEGPLRASLEAAITARGLQDQISLEGAMTQDKLVELFNAADLFALSPRIMDDGDRDGIPNVIVEAAATGVPIVTTAISGIPELIEDGRTGLLVPSNDPRSLALAMTRLLNDESLGRHMAAAVRARLEQCFDCGRNTGALRALMMRRVCEPVDAATPAALAAE